MLLDFLAEYCYNTKMKILSWKFQLAAGGVEFASTPTRLGDLHDFYCSKCDSIWSSKLRAQLTYGQCPECSKFYTYLIYFPSLNLYKIGNSSSVSRRRSQLGIKSEVILVIEHETRALSVELEKRWLENVKHLMSNATKGTFKYGSAKPKIPEVPYTKDIFPGIEVVEDEPKGFTWIK